MPQNSSVPFEEGDTVLEVALKNKLPLAHSCGGMGSCTTCRVIVENSVEKLSPRTEIEIEIIDGRGFSDNERLACQLLANPGLTVRIP